MELECSLPSSQQPATCPYPELERSSHAPHYTSWRSILILSSHQRQGLLSLRFPHQKPVCTSPIPIRATCPTHLVLLDLITLTKYGEEYRSLCSTLCSFLHSPVISPILGPNILLSTLFSSAPYSQTSSANIPPKCERPSFKFTKNRYNYSFVYLYLFYFWIANRKRKDSAPNNSRNSLTSICS